MCGLTALLCCAPAQTAIRATGHPPDQALPNLPSRGKEGARCCRGLPPLPVAAEDGPGAPAPRRTPAGLPPSESKRREPRAAARTGRRRRRRLGAGPAGQCGGQNHRPHETRFVLQAELGRAVDRLRWCPQRPPPPLSRHRAAAQGAPTHPLTLAAPPLRPRGPGGSLAPPPGRCGSASTRPRPSQRRSWRGSGRSGRRPHWRRALSSRRRGAAGVQGHSTARPAPGTRTAKRGPGLPGRTAFLAEEGQGAVAGQAQAADGTRPPSRQRAGSSVPGSMPRRSGEGGSENRPCARPRRRRQRSTPSTQP